MAFNEIKGKALRDFDSQRAVTVNRPKTIADYSYNPAPTKPKTIADYSYNPAPVRSSGGSSNWGPAPSSGLQGPMPDGGTLAAHVAAGGSRYDTSSAPVVNRPVGTGAPKGLITRAPGASTPPPPAATSSSGINYTPAARSSYGLLSDAAEGLAYNANKARANTSWRALAVFPNDPSAQAAYDEVYTSLQGQVDPADLERYATNAGQQAAQGGGFGAARNNAKMPVPTYREVPTAPSPPVDYGAFGGQTAAGNFAPVNRPITVDRPQTQPAPVPPPTRSDFVPPTTSRVDDLPQLDQGTLQQTYTQDAQRQIIDRFAGREKQIREQAAARGLSENAVFALVQQAEVERDMALGRSRNEAMRSATEYGADYGLRRAGLGDNYNLARGGFGISYAGDNRAANREDATLGLDVEAKRIANAGGVIANQGGVIANQTGQANADVATATTQARIDSIRATVQGQNLQNEATRFDIDQAVQAAPTVRATAQAQLQEIEQRVAKAARENDWATVDQLGKLAATIAKHGGFKIAGGILGGLMLTNPVTAGGAGYVYAAGGALDQVLGG